MIWKIKEPGMSNTEQTWYVSTNGGSRSHIEKTENSCWRSAACMVLFLVTIFLCILLCLDMCFGFSSGFKHLFSFLDCLHIRPGNSTILKHEKLTAVLFSGIVFPSLLHQILGIAYGWAKAIHLVFLCLVC